MRKEVRFQYWESPSHKSQSRSDLTVAKGDYHAANPFCQSSPCVARCLHRGFGYLPLTHSASRRCPRRGERGRNLKVPTPHLA